MFRCSPKAIAVLDTRKITQVSGGSLHSVVVDQGGFALGFGSGGTHHTTRLLNIKDFWLSRVVLE